jgi:hypothetical protein
VAPPSTGAFALTLAMVPETPLPRLLADLADMPPAETGSGFSGRQRHTMLALIV